MATVSKEIIDKLRQLSDLLVVIRDSENNTPQILKELAVEKCAEIYKALNEESCTELVANTETVVLESIKDTSIETKEDKEEMLLEKDSDQEVEDLDNEIIKESELLISSDEKFDIEIGLNGEDISENTLDYNEEYKSEETENIEETLPEPLFDENDEEDEDDEAYIQEDIEEDSDEIEDLSVEEEIDLFAPAKQTISKSSSHKKIRSILSINDIFLYKRELFGNSDVDMTDIFDGIDESSSFEEAYEIISEYFGDDVNSEEMIQEFIERVKSCFN